MEGVSKFDLDHQVAAFPFPPERLARFNHIRARLIKLGLIGREDCRYGGAGFGNLSLRHDRDNDRFVISGSQTGGLAALELHNLALVTRVDAQSNHLVSLGETPPSSEAMTHAMFYQMFPDVQAVIHVHSPVIWSMARALGLAETAADIPYGTPEMAMAIRALSKRLRGQNKALLIAMAGHEDGVVAAADNLEECAELLTGALANAALISAR